MFAYQRFMFLTLVLIDGITTNVRDLSIKKKNLWMEGMEDSLKTLSFFPSFIKDFIYNVQLFQKDLRILIDDFSDLHLVNC